jgi:two-component system heavy metal sensor histidine kinase CusS
VALATKRDAATYRDILASNAEEFQRLARMVSDMLFLAKTERGVDLPHKERFSARQDALALLDFYEAVAEEKRIRLRVEGDGEIEGDRLMFRRAVSNLLSNALRYTPEAGDITIRITATAQATTVAVRTPVPTSMPRFCPGCSTASTAPMLPGPIRTPTDRAWVWPLRAPLPRPTAVASRQARGGRTCFTLVFPHRVAKP